MNITATITSKGQITVPKVVRDQLKSRIVEFVVTGDKIELRPVESADGGLSEFAGQYLPIDEVREAVWGKDVP